MDNSMEIQDYGTMQLATRRRKLADASGGISGSDLRTTVLKLIRELDLRGAVADLGAGKGDVIRSFLEMDRFSSITGFDLMERPPDLPSHVQWQTADLNQPIACPADSFDLVACLGLIEFVENPYAFARELHRVLRPGGTAILSTPNNESWRRLISLVIRGDFVTYVNLMSLRRSDFERILRFAGFPQIRFSYSRLGMVPKLPVSWQAISGGMLRGLRYSDDLVVSCQKS